MIASRFGNKLYPAVGPSTSPVHVVVMHGLLGNHKNWSSVCRDLSQASTSASYQQMTPASAVSFPCVAFDWRNHGTSPHNPDHSLDGLAEDLESFLVDYSTHVATSKTTSESTTKSNKKVPILLVGHSMGGMGLMHFLWTRYTSFLQGEKTLPSSPWVSRTTTTSMANESLYEIVGCVVVDIAPAPRPQAFWYTAQAVEQLRMMPLNSFTSMADAESWLLANGKPAEVFQTPDSEWVVKYFLSNMSDCRRQKKQLNQESSAAEGPALKWDIAIDAIAEGGLKKLLWSHDNCVASLGSSSSVVPAIPASIETNDSKNNL